MVFGDPGWERQLALLPNVSHFRPSNYETATVRLSRLTLSHVSGSCRSLETPGIPAIYRDFGTRRETGPRQCRHSLGPGTRLWNALRLFRGGPMPGECDSGRGAKGGSIKRGG